MAGVSAGVEQVPVASDADASPWRRWLVDPLVTYVVIAATVGSIMCFLLPRFTGNDELAHFVRSYQISTGHLTPVNAPPHTQAGTGACVPAWLAANYLNAEFDIYARENGGRAEPVAPSNASGRLPTPAELQQFERVLATRLIGCGAGHYFVDTSTFAWYSPVAYLPSAGAIAVGRGLGWSSDGLDRAGRLAQLAAVIALIGLAIRRSPYAKWLLAIVGLVPTALVVASTIRPDAITTALSLLVIASALRAADAGGFTRRTLVDALVWSALLGLSKPAYWLVAAAFLVVIVSKWQRRDPSHGVARIVRDGGWLAVVPVAVAAAASTAWQSAQRNRFICDVRFFGIHVNTHKSFHDILVRPNQFIGGFVGVLWYNAGPWLRQLVQVDPIITGANWPIITIALVLLGFLVLALRPTVGVDHVPRAPRRGDRVVFALTALALLVALTGGFAIYCSSPGTIESLFFTARFLLPVFALLLLAMVPMGRAAGLLLRQPVPPVVALAAFYAVYLVAVASTTR